MKRLFLLILLFVILLPGQAAAQDGAEAVIFAPDLTEFPIIQTYLNLHNADGSFINGITADSVSILEDGKAIPVSSLHEQRIGVQTTVVINAAPTFANRNTLGITRYEYIVEYLNLWAARQKETNLDDLSLITNSGIRQLNLKDVLSWQTAFVGYQPDLKNAKPSPDLLGQAVDIALGYSSPTITEKAILYITPLPEFELGAVLQDVISRANQAGTHIFVWMITSKTMFADPRAEELRQLAIQTGGIFTAFSGTEEMTPISTMLEPLRSIYRVEYRSTINTSGQHNLAGQILLSQQIVTSLPVPFKVTVQPPNPIFVSPPTQIIRSTTVTKGDQLNSLSPGSQPIEVMVEFPDGHKRGLSSATLFVDGEKVAVNHVAPFERFEWDISGYKADGRHTVQVEVTDELGLTSLSRELPVDVVIVLPAINRWADFMNGGGIYLLLGLIFVTGVASTLLAIRLRERRRAESPTEPRKVPSARSKEKTRAITPGFKYKPVSTSKGATLALVTRDFQSATGYDIPLGERKFTIGSDRFLADVVLNADDVESRHTLIWRDTSGHYYTSNAIPAAVTLVNDIPVPEGGMLLKQDDLVTIGSVVYRYHEYPVHSSH
ncbi:MAG: hypothetical protein C0391_07895 [Anaerolinea sp.]|nr:hypothetical protein [Anaerolinea sp.]